MSCNRQRHLPPQVGRYLGDIDANAVYAAAVRRCERFSHLIEREHGALVVEDEHFAFAQVHEIVAVIAIDVHGVVGGSSRRSWLKDIEGGKAGFVAGKPIVSGGYISAYAIYPCGIIAICVGGFAGIAEVARLDSIELSAVEGSAAYKTEVCSGLPIQEFLLAYGRAVVLVFLTESLCACQASSASSSVVDSTAAHAAQPPIPTSKAAIIAIATIMPVFFFSGRIGAGGAAGAGGMKPPWGACWKLAPVCVAPLPLVGTNGAC